MQPTHPSKQLNVPPHQEGGEECVGSSILALESRDFGKHWAFESKTLGRNHKAIALVVGAKMKVSCFFFLCQVDGRLWPADLRSVKCDSSQELLSCLSPR